MKRQILFIIILVASLATFAQQKIKVACIGTSITYGAGMEDRVHNNYPAQLQNMLGSNYQVMNFGHSGATLLKKGNKPYWETKEYTAALASNPNIVFIEFGTNDSKAVNRPFYKEFVNDYKSLVASFQKLSNRPRIVLLLPPPSFVTDSNSIYEPIIKNQIIPMIQQAGYDLKVEIINLYPYFIDKPKLLPDQIHPSPAGGAVMAKRVYEVIKINTDNTPDSHNKTDSHTDFSLLYGFDCIGFSHAGRNYKIVKPRIVAKGRPWVWYAQSVASRPQTDVSLLERGFHIVYCDVAGSLSNEKYNFYKLMKQFGLNEKSGFSMADVTERSEAATTNFILTATGRKINFAAIAAAPYAEYNKAAGWGEGKAWWGQKADIDSLLLAEKPLDIVFLGNSITQGTAGHRTYVTVKPGFAAFDNAFKNYKWESAGISGDCTQNVLYRLQNGNFTKAAPKVMVLTIGVNNFKDNDSAEEIAEGIMAIANWVQKNMPATKLILSGPLPTGLKKDEPRRKKFEQIQALLAKQKGNYTYFPLYKQFLLDDGSLDPEKYRNDGIHLIPNGYETWASELAPKIEAILKQ